jgi:hypothetical protein
MTETQKYPLPTAEREDVEEALGFCGTNGNWG